MARIEIISPDSLRQLSAQFQRLQQQVGNLTRRLSAFRNELDDGGGSNAVAVTDEVIPARSGDTPGGPIKVQKKKIEDIHADPLTFVDDGAEVDCYSWVKSDSSDPADEDDGELWIYIEQDLHGVWWFTGQDCPPSDA